MQRSVLDALSTGWVGETLGVSRAAVSDWRRGKFPDRRRTQLEEAVRSLLPDTKEAAPPVWAERLVADGAATRGGVEQLLVQVAALQAALEASQSGLLLPGADPPGDPGAGGSVARRGQ